MQHVPFYYYIFLSFSHLTKRYRTLCPIWSPMFPLKVYKNPVYIYNKTENYYPPYSEDLKNLSLRSASSAFVNHLSSIITIFLVTRHRRAFHQLYIVHHLGTSFASRSTSYWYAFIGPSLFFHSALVLCIALCSFYVSACTRGMLRS